MDFLQVMQIPEYYAANYPTELALRKYRTLRDRQNMENVYHRKQTVKGGNKRDNPGNEANKVIQISYTDGALMAAAAAASSHPSNQFRPKSGQTPYNEGHERRSGDQKVQVQGERANNSLPVSYNDKETYTGNQAMHPVIRGEQNQGEHHRVRHQKKGKKVKRSEFTVTEIMTSYQ